jgi:hypothetical protein
MLRILLKSFVSTLSFLSRGRLRRQLHMCEPFEIAKATAGFNFAASAIASQRNRFEPFALSMTSCPKLKLESLYLVA